MTYDDVKTLFDYHYWARDRTLDVLDALTSDEFTRDLGNSFRSIRDTIAHTYSAEWVWNQRWQGLTPKAMLPAEQFPEGGHSPVGDATWNDQAELIEVGRDVEGKPVAGKPTRDSHADRRQLLPGRGAAGLGGVDPRPGEPGLPASRDAERSRHSNHDFFESPDILMHVAPVWIQVEDGIADDLTRSVVRHIAPSSRFEDLDTSCGQRFWCRQDVRGTHLPLHAERNDVRMLEEQKKVPDTTGAALFHERLLKRERLAIGDSSEAPDFHRSHYLRCIAKLRILNWEF